jgi:hypothetical protein
MKEIVEGLRGPMLGVVFVLIALAGTIVVAAFAALVAQMSLLLRLRPRENTNRAPTNEGYRVSEPQRPYATRKSRSPKDSALEQEGEEVVDGIWWQVQ